MSVEDRVTRLESNYMEQYEAHIKRQSRRKKRLRRRLIVFAIIVFIAVGLLASYHMKQRSLHAEKQAEYEALQEELETLKNEEKNLKQEIELLNDDHYILEIARTNYFFSKEGELLFKLSEDSSSN